MVKKLKLAVALTIILFATYFALDELQIDRCLDHGGQWDYERSSCVEDSNR